MSRIPVVTQPNAEQQALLDAAQAQLGMLPNFLKVFAHSPVVLKAFLGLFGIATATAGALDPQTRERIALALAQQNACEYCLSAHTALGQQAGLGAEEMAANRAGASQDAKAAAAVRFARALVEHLGEVTTAELQDVRAAGYGEAEIVEIITHVGMNLLTNILGKASRLEIDFPRIVLQPAA